MPDTRQPPQHQQKPADASKTAPSQSRPRPEDVQPESIEKDETTDLFGGVSDVEDPALGRINVGPLLDDDSDGEVTTDLGSGDDDNDNPELDREQDFAVELNFDDDDDDMDIPDIAPNNGVTNLIDSERDGRNRDNDVERLG